MADAQMGQMPDSRLRLVAIGPAVEIKEGEFVPAVLTIEAGRRGRISIPLGAFTVKEGKARFVATVDLVGLTGVILGVGVGRRAVRMLRPIAHAVADRVRAG